MDWDKEKREYQKKQHLRNIKSIGIKVFKVIKSYPPRTVKNDYKLASDDYKKQLNKTDEEEYLIKDLDIRVRFWNDREMYQLARVNMSNKIWLKVLELRELIEFYKFHVPRYVIYWKQSRMGVIIAFMTEQQYNDLKPILVNFDYRNKEMRRSLFNLIGFYGRNVMLPYSKLLKWYGGGTK